MYPRPPGPYELTKSGGGFIEQVIRPTGLVDPEVEIRPVKGQVDDLLEEIRVRAERNERVLVTTLTKRMAEDLSEYFTESACVAGISIPKSKLSTASKFFGTFVAVNSTS